MAKVKSSTTVPGNVAAAHEFLDDAASKIGKYNDIFEATIRELQERAETAEESLAKLQIDSARELAATKQAMQRDVDAQKARADAAEAKLRRLAADLA
jgi:hypothetical protein